jgi:hypothetical protein
MHSEESKKGDHERSWSGRGVATNSKATFGDRKADENGGEAWKVGGESRQAGDERVSGRGEFGKEGRRDGRGGDRGEVDVHSDQV